MARVLLVAQETGGVGKSTVVRGLAEAVEEAAIFEIESVHRLTEFAEAAGANVAGACRHFEMRASREKINKSGGLAAVSELDAVINAIGEASIPTIVDIGANQSASLFAALDNDTISHLKEVGVELGVVLVVAEEAGSLKDAARLNKASAEWAIAKFVVANELRGDIEADVLKRVAGKATVTHLRKFIFENTTSAILQDCALRGIRNIDRRVLIKEKGLAAGNRILRDLTAFRLAVMEAVRPAAAWLVGAEE